MTMTQKKRRGRPRKNDQHELLLIANAIFDDPTLSVKAAACEVGIDLQVMAAKGSTQVDSVVRRLKRAYDRDKDKLVRQIRADRANARNGSNAPKEIHTYANSYVGTRPGGFGATLEEMAASGFAYQSHLKLIGISLPTDRSLERATASDVLANAVAMARAYDPAIESLANAATGIGSLSTQSRSLSKLSDELDKMSIAADTTLRDHLLMKDIENLLGIRLR
ncbi:hypothetical protein [Parvularcula sp. LCG005]|uniref:hypothetical protein n=1 Tax=Parvularcula sp. LCG005 TaxID=3078805 RepID=UPI00294357F9|nr:hypothetical protein [Parvularcula sp. LCG005]WOI53946.1 hypothetical protein RUI03_02830 [Parvularcula sp. LCG005]